MTVWCTIVIYVLPRGYVVFFSSEEWYKHLENVLPVHLLREHFLTSSKIPLRNRIPLEHRDRIVRAFEDEEEHYLLVADTLGVNRSTARGIVARYIREGRIRERQR